MKLILATALTVEVSHQICSYGYHVTFGTWILPTLTPSFIPFQPLMLLRTKKKKKFPLKNHYSEFEERSNALLVSFLIKVNYTFGVRNFRWEKKSHEWIQVNSSSLSTHDVFAYWLNTKVKANENGCWNSSIFWTFGTSYECAHLWFWLIKTFKYLAFYLEICQPFLKSFNLGGGARLY